MSEEAYTLFAKLPYLDAHTLETRFTYLTPEAIVKSTRNSSLACTRVNILGSFKANRFDGTFSRTTQALTAFENLPTVKAHISKKRAQKRAVTTTGSPAKNTSEEYLTHLLGNYVTQSILIKYLNTHDLIALRQSCQMLRTNMDRDRSLWRDINLSAPRQFYYNSTQKRKLPSTATLPIQNILRNHLPGSPIPPYYHMRSLILDNYMTSLPYGRDNMSEQILNLVFENDCIRNNLKLLSIRGCWELTIATIADFLKGWDMKVRGLLRFSQGWKYLHSPDTSEFQYHDIQGSVVDPTTVKKASGVALEIFRFASPNLLRGVSSWNSVEAKRQIPSNIPSYLSIPNELKVSEDGVHYYKQYDEVFSALPISERSWSCSGYISKATSSAKRLGIELDVGFCKNAEAHTRMVREGKLQSIPWGLPVNENAWYWGVCERRWERCVISGCKWQGWTESCTSCRWEEGYACRGCFEWVCEDCRTKFPGGTDLEARASAISCGGPSKKCTLAE